MARPTLSVCITTYNMGHFLPLVIRNVEDLADEIVVLDSLSTDHTRALLANHPKVRFHEREFDQHYGRHKNAALEPARGDWILLLDSDELLGDELRQMLPRLIRSRWYSHYKIPRYWLVDHDPWTYIESEQHYPDYQLRLFRNEPFWRYGDDQPVHEHFPRKGRGRRRRLRRGHIFHFNFLLQGRREREAKVATQRAIDPEVEGTTTMYLYEDGPGSPRACREHLTGVDMRQLDELVGDRCTR